MMPGGVAAADRRRQRLPSRRAVAGIQELEKERSRSDRRGAWSAVRCRRGHGFLVNRATGTSYPAPCRSWRDCAVCARAYGMVLEARWSRVSGLRAFVVLTMPSERGDWRSAENRALMMRAWHRLAERLFRKFGRRARLLHFKEHAGEAGRLHLNVLWDFGWVDQGWLSQAAARAGFGPVCHISRIGVRGADLLVGRPGSSPSVRYSLKQGFKVRAYARKAGSQTSAGDDWPTHTRRWSASRAASREMGPRARNPDWYWAPVAPVVAGSEREPVRVYWLLPEAYLPHRATTERGSMAVIPPQSERPPPALFFLPFRSTCSK